jgi:hypothetical protein
MLITKARDLIEPLVRTGCVDAEWKTFHIHLYLVTLSVLVTSHVGVCRLATVITHNQILVLQD